MADTKPDAKPKMRAVTVSREYGSGGGEIATRLAKKLGWKLINHEVVVEVAKALGVTEAEAEAYDEHADNLVSRVLYGLSVLQPSINATAPMSLTTDSRGYDEARRRIVSDAYSAGNVVIVGRGAQVLLADQPDVLHVRVVSPLDKRVAYVMQREGLDKHAAMNRINLKDKDRTHFLVTEHHQNPADAHLYDITVNTGVIDLDRIVDLLVNALEQKGAMLAVSQAELGPAAGMTRYPEPPGNFTPSEQVGAGG